MNDLTRRRLLGQALAAGAGATVMRAFAPDEFGPGAALGAGGADVDALADPAFVAGKVADLDGDGGLTIVDPDGQLRLARVERGSQVWKRGVENRYRIERGDCLYARGRLEDDGVLTLENAWVAIQSLRAEVVRARGRELHLRLRDGSEHRVGVDAATLVADPDGRVVAGNVSSLAEGTLVHAIGYGSHPQLDDFVVTRLFAAARHTHGVDDAPRNGGERSLQSATVTNIYGLASWQCCGGVNACGSGSFASCNPPPSSTGACLTCRTDRHGTAWPNIINAGGLVCDVDCQSGCCPPGLPRLSCGRNVAFRNMCNNRTLTVPVNDCGPAMRCITPRQCQNFERVKFDLTACSFTGLGGNLGTGFITCQATV